MFENKIAIVTGGASGIGKSICTYLATHGSYAVIADINHKMALEVKDLICLKDKSETEGNFCAGADSADGIVAGTYRIRREGNLIEMEIHPLEAWQPIPGKIWVKTRGWKSSITVSPDQSVSMRSSWIRVK